MKLPQSVLLTLLAPFTKARSEKDMHQLWKLLDVSAKFCSREISTHAAHRRLVHQGLMPDVIELFHDARLQN